MALLSRSSLCGSVRRTPDEPSDDNLAPPAKKQRTQQETSPRRRKSSPDCLDTTTQDENPGAAKARPAHASLKPARPRTSTRRTRRVSSSSVDTVASSTQLNTPGPPRANGNGVVLASRGFSDRDTPSGHASAADLLRGVRESPDPLDTISPTVTNTQARSRPRAASGATKSENKSPAAIRTTRRTDHEPMEAAETVKVESKETTSAQPMEARPADANRSQRSRKSDPVEVEQNESAPTRDGRRSLRSADSGSRCKSELAQYFYNYEQLISLDDPKPELLAASTTITLIDDLPEPLPLPSSPDPTPFGNPLQNLYDCEVITLPGPALKPSGEDPLNEEMYFRAHRKFERQEKQLRNIERDRAQHEKQQVDRLLEELRGHDWLRVMGLTGVHENEKKLYEPKRQILIQELVALVNKFQVWKDEERRRKLAKDKPLPVADLETESRHSRKRSRPAEDIDAESSSLSETLSTPDPSDVDAWAARQLHQEAHSASVAKRRKSVSETRKPNPGRTDGDDDIHSNEKSTAKRQKTQHDAPPAPFFYPIPDKPFTSFFENRRLRDLAFATFDGDRRGRTQTILAFGHPIPELEEQEFQPPPELLTEEAIQASQRQRRRLKRRSHAV